MPTGLSLFIDSTQSDPDVLFANRGDDTIVGVTDGTRTEQIHVYADAGDDLIEIGPTGWITNDDYLHGAHIFGGTGADTIALNGLGDLAAGQVVSGRLDDFDPASDVLLIDGARINLFAPGRFATYEAEVIRYNGQQYLRIENAVGGQFIYALEGARLIDRPGEDPDREEIHFLVPNIDQVPISNHDWTVVRYRNPMNFVPESLYAQPPSGSRQIYGTANEEPEFATWEAGAETIAGTNGADYISGRSGNDVIYGRGGSDTIDGFKQFDRINGGAGDDIIDAGKGHDTVFGGDGDDLIAGGTDRDRLSGGSGNDRIWGGTENDTMAGGDGVDRMWGGFGNDRLSGGALADRLYGESGRDLIYGGAGRDYVSGGSGNDTLSGGGGNDRLIGAGGADRLSGGSGRDRLAGGAQADRLEGGHGHDTLIGDSGNDLLLGEDGDDLLIGGSGRDRLYGQDGDDRLAGGTGPDVLRGGAGDDVFVFRTDWGRDVVTDFQPGADRVVVDLGDLPAGRPFAAYVRQAGDDVLIDLGDHGSLTLRDADLSLIADDIAFI